MLVTRRLMAALITKGTRWIEVDRVFPPKKKDVDVKMLNKTSDEEANKCLTIIGRSE